MSSLESAFNRSVADILLPEYERETSIALSIVACDKDFPDLICESITDRRRIAIELVEVGLFFINQENDGLRTFEQRFNTEVLPHHRPLYRDTLIRLQLAHSMVVIPRPHRFPKGKTKQADLIVAEFDVLLGKEKDKLLPFCGKLLRDFVSEDGLPSFPALSEHFDGIMVSPIPESYGGRPHPGDPVIDLQSVTLHSMDEIDNAVKRSFAKKDRGASYTADMLVLHTLKADHKPYHPGTAMHAEDIISAALRHLPLLKERFNEVWFLNAYRNEAGKCLYELKS